MEQDVFKILKDLELKAVGLDPKTDKMQEGFFVSFRTIGLPIHKQDYENPFSPLGGNLDAPTPKTEATDPKDAPKTASSEIDEQKIALSQIGKSMQSYLNMFLLTDSKLRMNNEYSTMPGAGKVSDSWWAIITGANGIPVQSELNDEMKKAYEAAQAKLMDQNADPTPHYKAYLKLEEEYQKKVSDWNLAYAGAFTDPAKKQAWPIQGKAFHDAADQAMKRWISLGFKAEIEQAINTLAAQGVDPSIALISRARDRFNNSLLEFPSIGQIPYTLIQPSSWYDKDNNDGWTGYSSKELHTESHYTKSSTSYGGGGAFSLGFFNIGGKFNKDSERTSLNVETKNLEVSFKYSVADIYRPWLVQSLLNFDKWFLMGDYKKNCISNGRMAQEIPSQSAEIAFLPSIVTSLILIKDLSIKWDNWKSDWQTMSTSRSGSAVGWGPFAVHGSYSHHDENRDFVADSSGESLVVPGIQIAGYVSMINNACPGVDSAQFLVRSGGTQ